MKVRELRITDLEEEILFLLSIRETESSMLVIAEQVCNTMNVSLARVHETLIKLEAEGAICKTSSQTKTKYKITPSGIATLQTDWSHYSRNAHEQG